MSIKRTFSIAMALSVALLALVLVLAFTSWDNQSELEGRQRTYADSLRLASELRRSSDLLTQSVRDYVMTADPLYESVYWHTLDVRNGVAARADGRKVALRTLLEPLSLTLEEMATLNVAEDHSNELVIAETVAMNAVKGLFADGAGAFSRRAAPDLELARRLVFGSEYNQKKTQIMESIDQFFHMVVERTQADVQSLNTRGRLLLQAQVGISATLALVFICLFAYLSMRIIRPILLGSKAARQVAEGNLQTVWTSESSDEVGVLADGFNTMVTNLANRTAQLETRVEERTTELESANEQLRNEITERRQLEEQFLQSQRMEVVGKLAGGIAHDFNNLLTGISGYTTMLLEEIEHDSAVGQDLLQIHALADRAAGLTRQLLSFSRKQPMESVVLNLNTTVENTSKMLKRIIGEDIDLKFLSAPDSGNISANPGQIEQVLMNLAVNASDAMPNGGTLTVETTNVDLDHSYAEEHFGVEPGSYVMLSVSDDGCGMDRETRQHIFDPFFTTKDQGMGTGLGLSTVYGIVKQYEGHIWVYSEPGKGTTFKIYLPRAEAEVTGTTETPEQELVPEGSETVLVVEDERAVRDLVERILKGLGYKVFITSGASGAEKVFAQHSDTVDFLLTDVIMPGPSGPELYKSLVARRPSLKVLYMSGYTDISVLRHGILDQGASYLQKPFTPNDLARKVREVLDAENET